MKTPTYYVNCTKNAYAITKGFLKSASSHTKSFSETAAADHLPSYCFQLLETIRDRTSAYLSPRNQ